MHPMPEGVRLSLELPEWVKLSIADAAVLFGRIVRRPALLSSVVVPGLPDSPAAGTAYGRQDQGWVSVLPHPAGR